MKEYQHITIKFKIESMDEYHFLCKNKAKENYADDLISCLLLSLANKK